MTLLREFLSFDKFFFPKVARILFLIGAVLIAIATLIAAFSAFAGWGSFGSKMLVFLGTLLGGAASIIGLRIATEIALVLFSIDKSLKSNAAK